MQINGETLENGYYYIKTKVAVIGGKNTEEQFELASGSIVIAALNFKQDDDPQTNMGEIICAEIKNPAHPYCGYTKNLYWFENGQTDDARPFEIMGDVPQYTRFAELIDKETDEDFDEEGGLIYSPVEALNHIAEQVNTFGRDPLELLHDLCRDHGIYLEPAV